MSIEENKAAVRRYLDAAAARDFAAMHAIHADGWTQATPTSPQPINQEQADEMVRGFLAGFPDLMPTVDDQQADGDTVVTRLRWEGTHTGQFMGAEPTGKSVSIEVVRRDHFDADGRIASSAVEFDPMDLMAQIGAAPPAE